MRRVHDRINLLDLPEIVVEKIMGYMSYEEVAHLRIICRRFNQISQMLLNKGFRKVERYQAKCLKEVKSQLPRRESERKNHPLFRHCDILTAVETRLSLLNMTFNKYVESQMCCFIPGKVIDEIYRVLRFIQSNKTLPKSQEILTELRDISSMAMEHFEEKIVRSLKPTSLTPPSARFSPSLFSSGLPSLHAKGCVSPRALLLSKSEPGSSSSSELQYVIADNKYNKNSLNGLSKEVSELKSKLHELRRKVSEQERVALEQNRLVSEQSTKISLQEGKITELNRKLLEYDQRFSELQAEISRIREGCSETSASSSSKSSQFFTAPNQTTPAVGSALFVAANMVPVNITAAQLSSQAYLNPPQLAGYSSGGLAFTMPSPHPGSANLQSTTSTIPSTSKVSCLSAGALGSKSLEGDSLSPTSQALENPALPPQSSMEAGGVSSNSHRRKHRKRHASENDGDQDTAPLAVKWTKK
ncbi:F-box only protein 28-like [Penaeus chinensis]|uniref:F-box only protein 28-like n=1 Tax=Penaeus chinensis TaxID=139456 RepID=UPI001FB6103D|nr:F-box only protein 28-like [Penaeus chinensis]